MKVYLLSDIGGTFIKAGAAYPDGTLLPGFFFEVPIDSDGSADEICGSIRDALARGLDSLRTGGYEVAGIGIDIPGPFDYAEGIFRMTHKFKAVYGTSLKEIVRQLCELPVVFVHDVCAILEGINAFQAVSCSRLAVATIGTGLGFSHSIGGEVCKSPQASPARTIYKEPYLDGILEDYVSKRGILRTYSQLCRENSLSPGAAEPTVAEIASMARKGDGLALETFMRTGRHFALGARTALMEIRPEILFFGGQICRSFDLMEAAVRQELSDLSFIKEISVLEDMDTLPMLGALSELLKQTSRP